MHLQLDATEIIENAHDKIAFILRILIRIYVNPAYGISLALMSFCDVSRFADFSKKPFSTKRFKVFHATFFNIKYHGCDLHFINFVSL